MPSMKITFACSLFLLCCLPVGKSSRSLPIPHNFAESDTAPDTWKKDMLDQVNRLRSKGCRCGRKQMPPVPALAWNDQLEKSAETHAADMHRNNFMGHRGSNGSNIGKRADKAGYKWRAVAENVAWGQGSVEEVMLDWKDSPGHCINLMSKSYRDFGAARKGSYWVQEFGSSWER